MADSAVMTPARNLEAWMRNWESRRKTPHRRKFHLCSWSTTCLMTGMCVYSSICPVGQVIESICPVGQVFGRLVVYMTCRSSVWKIGGLCDL